MNYAESQYQGYWNMIEQGETYNPYDKASDPQCHQDWKDGFDLAKDEHSDELYDEGDN